ncbi:GNAT family N-acetyltransferase [Paenibacillus radicis (ex Gao et al. 2016)]|uniref:N-acetyltransferase n=1 Tax=Paenibacillus radicis (ex Gao et al. 2016) TaxID=1737354 RepID=A0A917M0H8_9BACL|nr:GNAT family N-acetyltransferase [Paenibacillus radicis (ex Gao et al. 2016)]GGG71182.1 N-acetyltransferase [Paenibacillus radicis (ex Gao et al. 2016)]
MSMLLPAQELTSEMEKAEIHYMRDRMLAIQGRDGNPEGIEIAEFGGAVCFYSRTMPWPSFNTVKGFRSADTAYIADIVAFFKSRDRQPHIEVLPSLVDGSALGALSGQGLNTSSFHTTMYMGLNEYLFADNEAEGNSSDTDNLKIVLEELQEDEFDTYATIHCRATGLPDAGIPPVASNNKVLYNRPGWVFLLARVNGTPAATAVMHMKDGIASLTFAATLPEYRNLGLQQQLIAKRFEIARANDCRLVVSQCAYLSQSHRNMERSGMRIGYIRSAWTKQK